MKLRVFYVLAVPILLGLFVFAVNASREELPRSSPFSNGSAYMSPKGIEGGLIIPACGGSDPGTDPGTGPGTDPGTAPAPAPAPPPDTGPTGPFPGRDPFTPPPPPPPPPPPQPPGVPPPPPPLPPFKPPLPPRVPPQPPPPPPPGGGGGGFGGGGGSGLGTGILDVNPLSMDYGDVLVGSIKVGSFTVRNIGSGALSGDVFGLGGMWLCTQNCFYSLSAGESLITDIQFRPTSVGLSDNTAWFRGPPRTIFVPVTGRGVSSLPIQCSDGIDNDGDGKIDFPADAGCESSSDSNESIDLPIFKEVRNFFERLLQPFAFLANIF